MDTGRPCSSGRDMCGTICAPIWTFAPRRIDSRAVRHPAPPGGESASTDRRRAPCVRGFSQIVGGAGPTPLNRGASLGTGKRALPHHRE